MSVLRRVKLRTPDGTESIEYPLGVEAKNVEVANQENLSQRLVRIDEDLEKNEEDIAAVGELAGTNKQNIGVNEIRIDALERRSASVDKKPYYFDTVADMKAYQELKAGDMAITLGYYEANDGGEAEYVIVDDETLVDDGGSIHVLTNGLRAKLIVKEIYVEMFGAKGNNNNNDTQALKNAINYCINKKLPIKSHGNKTYLITETLNFNNTLNLDFNNSTIKTDNEITLISFNYPEELGEENQGVFKNLTLDMNDVASVGIYGNRLIKKTFNNITIKNISNVAYKIDNGHEVIFENSHFYGTSNNSVGLELNVGDCTYKDIIMINIHTSIILNSSSNFINRIHSWLNNIDLIPGSIFIKTISDWSVNIISQCYSDTICYPFYIDCNHPRLKINQHKHFNNKYFMNNDVITNNGGNIYCFYVNNNVDGLDRISIVNSAFNGITGDETLRTRALFTNISRDNKLLHIDSSTIVTNWNDDSKTNRIPFIFDNDSKLIAHLTNNYIWNRETICELSLKCKPSETIASNTTITVGTIPTKYVPTTELMFIAPVYGSGYHIVDYVNCWLGTNGTLYVNTTNEITTDKRIGIDKTYITELSL